MDNPGIHSVVLQIIAHTVQKSNHIIGQEQNIVNRAKTENDQHNEYREHKETVHHNEECARITGRTEQRSRHGIAVLVRVEQEVGRTL